MSGRATPGAGPPAWRGTVRAGGRRALRTVLSRLPWTPGGRYGAASRPPSRQTAPSAAAVAPWATRAGSVRTPGPPAAAPAAGDTGPVRPARGTRYGARERAAAWAELLRVSALCTVPGDALAGAAAVGRRPDRGTALAAGASLCLYEAGMALNDWADRETDAVERPGRPLPSGRVAPRAALSAAALLTGAGLALAATAGRRPLCVAGALAGTVWSYDLWLKRTAAGPAAMATARALDLLLGAVATGPGGATPVRRPADGPGRSAAADRTAAPRPPGTARPPGSSALGGLGTPGSASPRGLPGFSGLSGLSGLPGPAYSAGFRAVSGPGGARRRPSTAALPAAAVLGVHTLAVTTVARRETSGAPTVVPLGAAAVVAAIGTVLVRDALRPGCPSPGTGRAGPAGPGLAAPPVPGPSAVPGPALATAPASVPPGAAVDLSGAVAAVSAALYAVSVARPLLHAVLNPSPPLLQRAVGAGLGALIPLQAALAARAGRPRAAVPLLVLLPVARHLSRKVSPT